MNQIQGNYENHDYHFYLWILFILFKFFGTDLCLVKVLKVLTLFKLDTPFLGYFFLSESYYFMC